MLSYGLVWGAAINAGMAGTDAVNRAYQALALVVTLIAVSATMVRILMSGRTRRAPAS